MIFSDFPYLNCLTKETLTTSKINQTMAIQYFILCVFHSGICGTARLQIISCVSRAITSAKGI